MYKIMMFEGGVYKFYELKELVGDLGGFILQESVMQTETMMHLAFPEEDEREIRNKIKELGGKYKELPLAGTEIIVVVPSLGKHHAVDPMCDIAEFLRRSGAITNMMGLARGVGRRIAQMTTQEKQIIEEFDAAVFIFGTFEECIEEKVKLCKSIDIPYIIVGGPSDMELEHYVGGVGRKTARMRNKDEIDRLYDVASELGRALAEKRLDIEEDPIAASPLFIKDMIEKTILPKTGEELPNVIQLDGLRVKIEEEDIEKIKEIEIGNKKLSEICEIKKSLYTGYLLEIKSEAVTGALF